MCYDSMMKLSKIKNCLQCIFNAALKKRQDYSRSETDENGYPFVLYNQFVVCIYVQYFFDVQDQNFINKICLVSSSGSQL